MLRARGLIQSTIVAAITTFDQVFVGHSMLAVDGAPNFAHFTKSIKLAPAGLREKALQR